MANKENENSTDEESLKGIFLEGMRLYENIEGKMEPTNSDAVQSLIKIAMSTLEKATRMVSLAGVFSSNESVEELPTESLQYLLLPALLGSLCLKVCNKPRREVIEVAEIYFRDFLQRCKDYGVTEFDIPPHSDEQPKQSDNKPKTEQARIVELVSSRDAKIKRYKESKELKEKLSQLKVMMKRDADDDSTRNYFLTLIRSMIMESLDELDSLQNEKPLLEYMEKHGKDPKPAPKVRPAPLKPVIITRDAIQKAVYGAGYPSLPTMTVEEFYEQRVRDGTFPSASNIPHTTVNSSDEPSNDTEEIYKERLIEQDDESELHRQRNMDDYKDDHRRGWGNRHNRS